MNNFRIPSAIAQSEILANEASFSPGMYRQLIMPARHVEKISSLLDPAKTFDRGVEPGSIWYLRRSPTFLIRTKALQDHSYLIYPKGDSITPVNPRVFHGPNLTDGDILMSKDSNVGECAMIDGSRWQNHMFSGGIVRLHPAIDRYYFFGFLKHPIFKAQLQAKAARGSTITHAKTLWLDCLIPFPGGNNSKRVMEYVSALTQAIVEKEREIRSKNRLIDSLIRSELEHGQNPARTFSYQLPRVNEIRDFTRLDAAIYSEDTKAKLFLIENYKRGSATYRQLGFEVTRGQNLQVSCIGTSIYSDEAKPDFYRLVAPTDISEYRTVRRFRYLGNWRSLSLLDQGDVVFGAEGFCKGRVLILAETMQRTLTNIHGVIFHRTDSNLTKGIFLGCFLGYLRNVGLVDAIGAGGSGGSLAIGYFDHVPIPKFSDDKQAAIAQLYHNPLITPTGEPTLGTFVEWHRKWNESLGIWELDREMKALQQTLSDVQERIIQGETFEVPVKQ